MAQDVLNARMKKAISSALEAAMMATATSNTQDAVKATSAAFRELADAASEPYEVAVRALVADLNHVLEQRDNLHAALADIIAVLTGKPAGEQPYARAAAAIAAVAADDAHPLGVRLPTGADQRMTTSTLPW